MSIQLKHTPLYDWHKSQDAKTADFGGWEMPIEYQGVVAEHEIVRTAVGIFDVSHMGKIEIQGLDAAVWLNTILTNNLETLPEGKAQYSMLLNGFGGVIDDLIVYKFSNDLVWMVPNASNASDVFGVLETFQTPGITLKNHHNDFGIIAVQGPKSEDAIAALGLPEVSQYMSAVRTKLKENDVVLCRTGYTGEIGFEIIAPNEILLEVWQDLIAFGASPIGLAARDTLRLEMGYALHGHEISQDINPIEAGLSWAIAFGKPKFQGRENVLAVKAVGATRKRVALSALERGIPRADMNVLQAEEVVGVTTSGTFSPSLKNGIALALVDAKIKIGDLLELDVRGRRLKVEVVSLPFVKTKTI
jgi:aminomethyltransferase